MRLPLILWHVDQQSDLQADGSPGLLKRLKERKEVLGSKGLHSALSLEYGVPEMLVHIGLVTGIMKIHTVYPAFEKQLDAIAPIYPADPGLFDNVEDWDASKFKIGDE